MCDYIIPKRKVYFLCLSQKWKLQTKMKKVSIKTFISTGPSQAKRKWKDAALLAHSLQVIKCTYDSKPQKT